MSEEMMNEETKETEEISDQNREDVKQPDNMEAIVEGLLYVVGEDGVKAEQLAVAIDKSLEDTKIIL